MKKFVIPLIPFAILMGLYFQGIDVSLLGSHKIRQADTLFTAYSFCQEAGASFLYPKTVFRSDTRGTAIGEFPVYSWILSIPCQILGTWSEATVKITMFILFILSIWIWGIFFKNQFRSKWPGALYYSLIATFSSHALSYLLIAIPDVASVLMAGLAGVFYQKSENRQSQKMVSLFYIFSLVLFTASFLIRPYMIPVLALIIGFDWQKIGPSIKKSIPFFVICVVAYFLWYKYWAQNSDVEYYAIKFKISVLFEKFFEILQATGSRFLKDILNFIGLPFLIYLLRQKKISSSEIINVSCAFLLVWGATTYAIINHGYYLMAVWLLVIAIILKNFTSLKKNHQIIFLVIWILYGILDTAHQFDPKKSRSEQAIFDKIIADLSIKPLSRIVIYQEKWFPEPFYRLKSFGYSLPVSEFSGENGCPPNAKFFYLAEKKQGGKCLNQKENF